ncbi:MAG: UDP-N-acetylmuramate--L-alanine ligase [Thermodesulfobacteriota bacterium]
MYNKRLKLHFVGIGGIGMSGIAELLLNLGYRVSGSDLRQSATTRRLAKLGGTVHVGHSAEWVGDADVVVVSTAVREDNPEVIEARSRFIPVIPRAAMLAELMRLKSYPIAVAGSHGKTSTTSMLGAVLAAAGMDPTVVIGGQVNSLGTNAQLGGGDFLVAEADESDGSFLHLSPVLEVVTNIDLEHLDYYLDLDQIRATFLEFIGKVPFWGAVVLCIDDPNVASILAEVKKRVITYGLSAQADIHAREVSIEGFASSYEVYRHNEHLGRIRLALPGRHYVQNSLAVVAVGLELDIPFPAIAEGLARFSGVQRRLQVRGEAAGVLVVDDYGHHPTEIRATLEAVREALPQRRLVVLFQPHRYSRTQKLFEEFCTAFHQADALFLTDIYPASEAPIPGITGEYLARGIVEHGHRNVTCCPAVDDLAATAAPALAEGDVVVTLGAGSITGVGPKLLALLGGAPVEEE